jgi:hypothetical protein
MMQQANSAAKTVLHWCPSIERRTECERLADCLQSHSPNGLLALIVASVPLSEVAISPIFRENLSGLNRMRNQAALLWP